MAKLEAVAAAEDAPCKWETGELGRDPKHVERATPEQKQEIEAALGLQMISIRLQKELLTELKLIAEYRGIGYQPLIRDILSRFARTEMMQITRELQEQQKAREAVEAELAARPKKRA